MEFCEVNHDNLVGKYIALMFAAFRGGLWRYTARQL